MLDDFIELILELILDGAIEAAGSKRVPMPVRILLAAMIMALVFSVCGLLIYIGVGTGNALVGVDLHKIPFWFGLDEPGVVVHLGFITGKLLIAVSGNAGISSDTSFPRCHRW